MDVAKSIELNEKLDEIRDLLVELGMYDETTAEAVLHGARPGDTNIVGNLADLQRMGAIAVAGQIPTPPGQPNIETADVMDAFVEPPSTEVVDPPRQGVDDEPLVSPAPTDVVDTNADETVTSTKTVKVPKVTAE